jgi:hypothetical protein
VLRRIFEPKTNAIIGDRRKVHRDLYSSPNMVRMIKSRRMIWAGQVARIGAERNAYRILVGKQEGKRQLGRPRCRCEDNIKMGLR